MTGRNHLAVLNLCGVSLLDFCASHGVHNEHHVEHKDAHKCVWNQSIQGQRSMIESEAAYLGHLGKDRDEAVN